MLLLMLRVFVTRPAQRPEVGQLEAERWVVLKRNDVMYFCGRCYFLVKQALLTEVVITMQRLLPYSAPCCFMVEALFFESIFPSFSFDGWMITAPHVTDRSGSASSSAASLDTDRESRDPERSCLFSGIPF